MQEIEFLIHKIAKNFFIVFNSNMNIRTSNNINFGIRVNTFHVIEITTLKVFEKDGFLGMTNTVKKLCDVPSSPGCVGYKHYAKLVGRAIQKKYSDIALITKKVNEIIKQNPNISQFELHTKVSSLIAKLGEEIDIEI